MISYVKIYGPPVLKALKTLEKIAVDEPRVCIMDTLIAQKDELRREADTDSLSMEADTYSYHVADYFGPSEIDEERCDKIISKSGEKLGEYDFFFEWFKNPTADELNILIQKIDTALAPLGCKYTIITK